MEEDAGGDERADGTSPLSSSGLRHLPFSRRGKPVAASLLPLVLVIAGAIVVPISVRSNNDAASFRSASRDVDGDGFARTKIGAESGIAFDASSVGMSKVNVASQGTTQAMAGPDESRTGGGVAVASSRYPWTGGVSKAVGSADGPPPAANFSDAVVADPEVLRKSAFGSTDCPAGEELWSLFLRTDDYPWEIKWELRGDEGGVLASGPPEGKNYERGTAYAGTLCLPVGQYRMRWFDAMGDGLCCEYGRGEWRVSVNGEVVLESDPASDEFTQKDYPFAVTAIEDEIAGTFLIMPRPYDPVLNVELPDGTIFALNNLPPGYDYAENGLVSGVTSIALPKGTVLFANGTADMQGEGPRAISGRLLDGRRQDIEEMSMRGSIESKRQRDHGGNLEHRRLANFEGDQTVLIVRVIAADGTTTAYETALGNGIFGNGVDPHNLASQMKACSYGKMNLIKTEKSNNGVTTIHLPSVRTAQGDALMRNAITLALDELFGVDSPSELANYVVYCLPPGTYGGIAYAYINHWLSVFNDHWCESLSLQMHEIGHNLNFGHSNEDGVTYEDESGIMGYSYPNDDVPLKCFNAAKSWQTGWYRDKSVTVNSNGSRTCFKGVLHGVADYPAAATVLLRIQTPSGNDYFINYNSQRGMNRGTQEGQDNVTVVRRPRGRRDSYAESELAAKLGGGESYAFAGYTVKVGRIRLGAGTAEVEVSPSGREDCEMG